MKCIYCNAETDLTSSDIISYAITGAKLSKSFVCRTHNQFTNDNYEKKFIADLAFYRNSLGLLTRDGKPIQYIADLTIDGYEMFGVKVSTREALYNPKGVVAGIDDNGDKILFAPPEKLNKIRGIKCETVDTTNAVIHKTMSSNVFTCNEALHSVAKIAYEWYCYIHNIEEYNQEIYHDIVSYILDDKHDTDIVEILFDKNHYYMIDQLSEAGTNSFYEYDDTNGYHYVVYDLWGAISYRIRICKTQTRTNYGKGLCTFDLHKYIIDGSKDTAKFGICSMDGKMQLAILNIIEMSTEQWSVFVKRLEKLMSTFIVTLNSLRPIVNKITSNVSKFQNEEIDLATLLDFEDNDTLATIKILNHLYEKQELYNFKKSFNQNLHDIFNAENYTISMDVEHKKDYVTLLVKLYEEGKLIEYIKNGLQMFEKIYSVENQKRNEG